MEDNTVSPAVKYGENTAEYGYGAKKRIFDVNIEILWLRLNCGFKNVISSF